MITFTILFVLALTGIPCDGEIILPNMIASGMVLQRGMGGATIWGKSRNCGGAPVLVRLKRGSVVVDEHSATPTGEDFEVTFASQSGSMEAHTIEMVDCGAPVTLSDVLFGDVIHCAGQSNAERPLVHSNPAVPWEVTGAAQVKDQLLQLDNIRSFSGARETLNSGRGHNGFNLPTRGPAWGKTSNPDVWELTGADNGGPSAICMSMALEISLVHKHQLAIGVVATARGGSSIEQFSSPTALADVRVGTGTCGGTGMVPRGLSIDTKASDLWNRMVGPVARMRFAATIWFQGERNSEFPEHYKCLLPAMIADLRRHNNPNMWFFTVLLSGYGSSSVQLAPMREAQRLGTLAVPRADYIVSSDQGHRTDIHSPYKVQIGRRGAMLFMKHVLGLPVDTHGPVFQGTHAVEVLNGEEYLRVHFAEGTANNMALTDGTDCNTCCASTSEVELQRSFSTWVSVPAAAISFDVDTMLVRLADTGVSADTYSGIRVMQGKFSQCAITSDFPCLAGVTPITPFSTT